MNVKAVLALALGLAPYAAAAQKVPGECDWKTVNGVIFWRCVIKMQVVSGKLQLVDPFRVPPGVPVKLVWKLTQNKFHFRQGDGILLRNESGQFSAPCATGSETGECTTVTKPRRFKWFVRNSGGFEEPYCVAFHDDDGNRHTFDPTIINSWVLEADMGVRSTRPGASVIVAVPPSSCDGFSAR
jgi:hypothetical protein